MAESPQAVPRDPKDCPACSRLHLDAPKHKNAVCIAHYTGPLPKQLKLVESKEKANEDQWLLW